MRITVFLFVLVLLFFLELIGPVQKTLILPLTRELAEITAMILQFFDDTVSFQGVVIINNQTREGVSVQPGCNGVEAIIILVAAIIAVPASHLQKLAGIVIGSVAIQSLNIFRLISLFYLVQWNRQWFEWAHLYLWQALIILDALIVFVLWLRWLNRTEARSVASD